MKTKLCMIFIFLISPAAFANDPNSFVCKNKIADMKNSDFPKQEETLSTETSGKIKLTIDEKSFQNNTMTGCDFLGSTNFSLIEYVVNTSAIVKQSFGKKVKTITYKNSAKAKSPEVKLEGDNLQITKNFENDWTKGNGLSTYLNKIFAN